ncbi:MAG: signal peptide peptidase SppA [Syntrophobacterales bacterium]|nr:signal peptide peptidase SppA [Syntrophobacterales bacterium]
MRWRQTIVLLAWGVSCLWGCVTVKVDLFEEQKPLQEKVVSGRGQDKILLVDISGFLTDSPRRGLKSLFGGTDAARLKEELEKAGKDPRIKAVVLRINSPGGMVSGADLMHHEILVFKREHRRPVIAALMGVAASGGYFVAQAADVIVAQPSGVTGSIGVVALKPNLKGLMDRTGIEAEVVKSGRFKDFWSPFKPAGPEEKQLMEGIIADFYGRFLEVVAQGRGLSPDKVRPLADGRIFTAAQAKDLGLVDRIGYLDDALALARERAGLTEARVVVYHRPGSYRPTIYSLAPELLEWDPRFFYLWLGEDPL